MVVANNEIEETKNAGKSNDFDGHGDAAVQRGAHRLMEHIQGFTRSHWMQPSGECLRRIAPAAAWSTNSLKQHKTLTKNYF
jgi:hypothetical protein